VLGSTGIFAAVDTALVMKNNDGDRVIESEQSYGASFPKTVLAFDRDTETISLRGEWDTICLEDCKNMMLDIFATGEGMTRDRILESVEGFAVAVVNKAFTSLKAESKLIPESGTDKRGDPFIYVAKS